MRVTEQQRKFAGQAALVLVALFGGNAIWRHFGGGETNAARLFHTRPVNLGVVEKSVAASGAVKALVTVDVGSQLSGPIMEMKVDFNSVVKQGDLLAVIDRAPFEAKASAAAAGLAVAKADVGLREAAIAKIQKQLAHYDRDVGRYRALTSASGVSRQQVDQAETQSAVARQELAAAHAELEAAKANVVLREADLAQAEINLNRTLIRSPINGVVIDRRMQRGQTVTAEYQTPVLFQIAQDLSQILILAQVDEADIGAIHTGDSVTFTVEAFPEEIFTGVVDQVRLAALKTSGVVTYTVVVRAQNPGLRLFPDMTATVRIVTARRENALSVPNEALRFRPAVEKASDGDRASEEQSRVWVLEPGKAIMGRRVRLGVRGDAATEILDGELQPGETVIVRAKDAASSEKN